MLATRLISEDAHPYMAISPPGVVAAMLEEIGLDSVEPLFEQIPEAHRLTRPLDLEPPLPAALLPASSLSSRSLPRRPSRN